MLPGSDHESDGIFPCKLFVWFFGQSLAPERSRCGFQHAKAESIKRLKDISAAWRNIPKVNTKTLGQRFHVVCPMRCMNIENEMNLLISKMLSQVHQIRAECFTGLPPLFGVTFPVKPNVTDLALFHALGLALC